MWMTLLAPILMNVFGKDGLIGTYAKTKADEAQARLNLELQVQKDKMLLSTTLAQAAVDSEKNKLNATSQTFKAVSFCLLTTPIIITCLNKAWGAFLWANMSLIPSWYAQMYVAVVFVIWGLPVAADASSRVFQSITDAWLQRQDKKIEKVVAIASSTWDDTKYFAVVKKMFPQGLSQEQVNILNEAKKAAVEPTL